MVTSMAASFPFPVHTAILVQSWTGGLKYLCLSLGCWPHLMWKTIIGLSLTSGLGLCLTYFVVISVSFGFD